MARFSGLGAAGIVSVAAALVGSGLAVGVLVAGPERGRAPDRSPAAPADRPPEPGARRPEARDRTGRDAGTGDGAQPPGRPAGGSAGGAPGPWGGAGRPDASARGPVRPRLVRDLGEALGDVRAALAGQDFERLTVAEAALRTWLGVDPERALALVGALADPAAAPEVVAVLADALLADPTLTASPAVAAALLAVAEDGGAGLAARESALLVLGNAAGAPPDAPRRLHALATGPGAAPSIRAGALAALASLASARGESDAEPLGLLLGALRAEPDTDLRATLLAGVPLSGGPPGAVTAVASFLRDDRDPQVRAAAASALGDAPAGERARALSELEAAFLRNPERDVRRHALTSMIRLAGPGAAPILERLRPAAGAASPDVADYLAILGRGETQADRIFDEKMRLEISRGDLGADGGHDHED